MLSKALFGLALLLLAAMPSFAQRRGIPRAFREAMVGCWEPWPGERWDIRRHDATELTIRIRTDVELLRERFRVRGHRTGGVETITWSRSGAAHVPCGPRTQHGQFCLVRLREDRRLDVGVYRLRHGPARSGQLAFTAVAERKRCPN